jgi:hypothetical protein
MRAQHRVAAKHPRPLVPGPQSMSAPAGATSARLRRRSADAGLGRRGGGRPTGGLAPALVCHSAHPCQSGRRARRSSRAGTRRSGTRVPASGRKRAQGRDAFSSPTPSMPVGPAPCFWREPGARRGPFRRPALAVARVSRSTSGTCQFDTQVPGQITGRGLRDPLPSKVLVCGGGCRERSLGVGFPFGVHM